MRSATCCPRAARWARWIASLARIAGRSTRDRTARAMPPAARARAGFSTRAGDRGPKYDGAVSQGQAAPVATGDILAGKYRVDRVLGIGGMGVVVAATHMTLDQRVAIKFM